VGAGCASISSSHRHTLPPESALERPGAALFTKASKTKPTSSSRSHSLNHPHRTSIRSSSSVAARAVSPWQRSSRSRVRPFLPPSLPLPPPSSSLSPSSIIPSLPPSFPPYHRREGHRRHRAFVRALLPASLDTRYVPPSLPPSLLPSS